jgi:hypothetical protein
MSRRLESAAKATDRRATTATGGYERPRIVDYGTVEELTAGCHGSPKDFHGKNNALTDRNSRGMCFSSP